MIFTDVDIPKLNDMDTIRMIKTIKNVPIIVLIPNALEKDEKKFLNAGMKDYLSKPLGIEKIILIYTAIDDETSCYDVVET